MKRFFGMNSGVFKFMGVLLELAEIGILFLICSIPIVTIGASYAAMPGKPLSDACPRGKAVSLRNSF